MNSFVPLTKAGYESLVDAVQQATGVASPGEAAELLRATLETTGEFATPDQAARLAAHLPLELRSCLLAPAEIPGERSFGEFCCRLTVRTNLELLVALDHARRVFRVLMRHATPAVVHAPFPDGFDALFAEA